MSRLLDFLLGRKREPPFPTLSPGVEDAIHRSEAVEHLAGRAGRMADAALSGDRLPESPQAVIRDARAIWREATEARAVIDRDIASARDGWSP